MRTGISGRDIRARKFLTEERKAFLNLAAEHRKNIFLSSTLRTPDEIASQCRLLKATDNLKAVFIDYIQNVNVPHEREKEKAMTYAAHTFRQLSTDLGIAVICGSQVNKDHQKRDTKRLAVEDLKYASSIGESARVAMMFQRPHQYDLSSTEHSPCAVWFAIEKNSEGVRGEMAMHFNPVTQRFDEGDCTPECRHHPSRQRRHV